jgi:peptidase M49-like protein
MRTKTMALAVILAASAAACRPSGETTEEGAAPATTEQETPGMEIAPDVAQRLAKFTPVRLEADLSALSPADRRVLDLLVEASRAMDEIFLRQVWAGNPELRQRLAAARGPRVEAARDYFAINFGPWDRLADLAPFIGSLPHPDGAGYYPVDMTKAEFEAWVAQHPEEREAFISTTTVIRREGDRLVAVPYAREYAAWLEPAARLLRQAAEATDNGSLQRFLTLRADAFSSDDYYASDMAWMDLDAPVEVTIGPYETYEDSLFGYKAAYESFVTVALPAESAALARYKERLPWLEGNLPLPEEHKNRTRGSESPIRVVDEVFTAGDTRGGVQTLAFNLPNDERVRQAKGSKKVLLRNIMRAKYDRILLPIAERALVPEQVGDVSWDAYFNEVLHHELSHGLGPGTITVGGRKTEVRHELKDLYDTLEEAKADVMGVYNILALIEEGEMPAALRRALEPTYVAGLFRSARFGVTEAHGQGVTAQFNYLLAKGALVVDAQGRFRAVSEKFPAAVRDLLHDMLLLEATGDYAGTQHFLERYGKATPELLAAIGRLGDVPVDVRPVYAYAEAAGTAR